MSSEFARGRLSLELERALRAVMTKRAFSKGAMLYERGMAATGVYLVETGGVRIVLPAGVSESQLLDQVGAGAVLGLSETMSGEHYRVSAEAEEPTTVNFIPRKSFMEFMDGNPGFCMELVRLLSENLHGLYHKFRSVSAHPGRPRRRSLDEQLN